MRQKTIDYINFCYKIFNEDYAHIVDMAEITEQSFYEMKAYLLVQEIVFQQCLKGAWEEIKLQLNNYFNLSFS